MISKGTFKLNLNLIKFKFMASNSWDAMGFTHHQVYYVALRNSKERQHRHLVINRAEDS